MFRCGEAYFSPEYKGRVWRLFFVCMSGECEEIEVKIGVSGLGFEFWVLG
jgi:hypothetical protein